MKTPKKTSQPAWLWQLARRESTQSSRLEIIYSVVEFVSWKPHTEFGIIIDLEQTALLHIKSQKSREAEKFGIIIVLPGNHLRYLLQSSLDWNSEKLSKSCPPTECYSSSRKRYGFGRQTRQRGDLRSQTLNGIHVIDCTQLLQANCLLAPVRSIRTLCSEDDFKGPTFLWWADLHLFWADIFCDTHNIVHRSFNTVLAHFRSWRAPSLVNHWGPRARSHFWSHRIPTNQVPCTKWLVN